MNSIKIIREELQEDLRTHVAALDERLLAVRAPARSEIAGNHTDHEGGRVIAAALDRSIDCLAQPNDDGVVRVFSRGFDPVEVALDDLAPREAEYVSSDALVRGMAYQMSETGRTPVGFDLAMTSDIPSGGGLSSSAAYELAMCRAMEALWPGREVSAIEAAQMAQRVERDWFGKPCGLMDQLAVSLGGLAIMDFVDDEQPTAYKMSFDFERHGYALCLIDVGSDHSAYTDEYAAVPAEMQAVARVFGADKLVDVHEDLIRARVGRIRSELGDRALLRALHFYMEQDSVDERWRALQEDDIERFLALTERSGASSAMYLQNVSVGGTPKQDCMVAIALSERLLAGRGATRIHGGGFGGSVQAFVPLDMLDRYVAAMDDWLGEGACKRYGVSDAGAKAAWV